MRFFIYFQAMKELIFATHNRHKSREIQALLKGAYRIIDLEQLGYRDPVPEDRETLEENAAMKARHIHRIFQKDCFADDTGLEVECLNGAPGVYSARYAGMTGDRLEGESQSQANIRKLLKRLEGESNRKARFRTVVCLILDRREYSFEGIVGGQITGSGLGGEGFGYDPVFLPDGYSVTFAQMALSEKNRISHRALAARGLADFLKKRTF